MEVNHRPEKVRPQTRKNKVKSKGFSQINKNLNELHVQEENSMIEEFLSSQQIEINDQTKQVFNRILQKRRVIEPNFSLFDLTNSEIEAFQSTGILGEKEALKDKQVKEAKSTESLIDQWKAEGFSNYQTLQKLIAAHDNGDITLLSAKVAQFKKFFHLLQDQQFSPSDTQRIIQVVDQNTIDFTAPDVFDQIIFTIYEDDQVSIATKEKICQKFKLFPITTGDDLKSNLKLKRQQVQALERQKRTARNGLESLNQQHKSLKTELADLKEVILRETDFDKRLALEKRYDELEATLSALEEDRKTQQVAVKKLAQRNITSKVFLRGAEADWRDGEIIVSIPQTTLQVSVPDHLSSTAIAKAVNAYLLNEQLKVFGLESFFFYQSDFHSGNYPHPMTLDRCDLFLFRVGLSYDSQILSKTELRQLGNQLGEIFPPDQRSINLTLYENAQRSLIDLNVLRDGDFNHQGFAELLNQE